MAKEKKKIFDIEIPLIRQKVSALAVSQDALNGKIIKLDMTKLLRGKNIDAAFQISKKGDRLEADFKSIAFVSGYIKRMMRKGISWVEDSFVCLSKDGLKIRIKPFFITKNKIHRSVKNALRKMAKDDIINFISERNAQEIFSSVVYSEFQKSLAHHLKKIYPLALCEIRSCKIIK